MTELEDNVLNYRFRKPELLLAAVTHPSGKAHYHQSADYEKLEALGDAVLDYLIGVNMMRNTMFERYIPRATDLVDAGGPELAPEQQRKLLHYQVIPDYQPGDAHQAKLKLAKNELLSKLSCIMGLQEYCLYRDRREENLFQKKDVRDFLRYSFRHKNFPMNQRRIEPFESPKLLGDIFESVIGAIYEDSGLDEVQRVFRHLLSPLILFNTQFSKLSALYGEPKE